MVLFADTREERAKKRAKTFERLRREKQRGDRPAYPVIGRFNASTDANNVPFSNKKLVSVVRGAKPVKRKASGQHGELKLKMGIHSEGGGEMELDEEKLVVAQNEEGEEAKNGEGGEGDGDNEREIAEAEKARAVAKKDLAKAGGLCAELCGEGGVESEDDNDAYLQL